MNEALDRLSHEELADIARILTQQSDAYEEDKLSFYQPHKGQSVFHQADYKVRLLVTGNRFGKSTCTTIETIWLANGLHPYHAIPVPNKGKLYGESFDIINKTLGVKFEQWAPRHLLDKNKPLERNALGHTTAINWANGSRTVFGSYEQHASKSESTDWDYVGFDEPPPRDIWIANFRGIVDRGGRMWIAATPLSEAWVYDELWQPGLSGTKPYVFCMSGSTHDNPHLDQQTLKIFEGELSESERATRIEGQFTRLKGLVYDTFEPYHSLIDPFPLTEEYTLYEGVDPHPGKANAVLWKAISEDGLRFVVAELKADKGIAALGKEIARMRRHLTADGAYLARSIADSSLNQKDMMFKINQKDELTQALRDCGETVFPETAQKRDWLRPGIAKLRDLYRPVLTHLDGKFVKLPTQYVFKTCEAYRHELMHYQWPKGEILEDTLPVAKNNDLLDCDRYIESIAPKFQTPGQTGIIYQTKAYQKKNLDERMYSKYFPGAEKIADTESAVRYRVRDMRLRNKI